MTNMWANSARQPNVWIWTTNFGFDKITLLARSSLTSHIPSTSFIPLDIYNVIQNQIFISIKTSIYSLSFFFWNNCTKAPERRLTNRSCYKCNQISGSIFTFAAFKHRTPTINRFTNIHDFSFFHWFLSVLLRMARFSRYAVKMSFIWKPFFTLLSWIAKMLIRKKGQIAHRKYFMWKMKHNPMSFLPKENITRFMRLFHIY